MGIYKIESGLIFDDRFETMDARWIASPSGSIRHEVGKVTLDHSDSVDGTKLLFELPKNVEAVFQVEADYIPTEIGDEGGVVVWNSAISKMEFLESVENQWDTEYNIWRAKKKNNLWSFFAFRNSSWELFDSSVFNNPTLVGVTLKGGIHDAHVPLTIKRATLCKGTHITVGNVNSGYRVELLDELGNVAHSATVPDRFAGVTIELPAISFRGKLRIYDKPNATFPTGELKTAMVENVTFYGGDVYLNGTPLEVHWNGHELMTTDITHLGTMKNNQILTKMTAVNNTSGEIALNTKVAVRQYQEEFGWEWVDVANVETGPFGDVVHLGDLYPGDTVDFWVRVERRLSNFSTAPTHFMFDLDHE